MRLALLSSLSLTFSRWKPTRSSSSVCPDMPPSVERRSYRLGPWQRWRTRQQLAQLDARQLADIGLTRAQVDREVRQAFWR
ncbi:MAG: DUF1127 domain-containing protein [Salinicola sp.]|uniref:DUF1127 domain-containing protein n=1 Tax=Salinicola sp. TaxID=1978524 RepID=UPI001D8A3A5C|nr:DUF1127 domain-containing protein [Salinicola sp.]NRB55116.1 DUF1127 domain-containing protein [Salinicola sp.]